MVRQVTWPSHAVVAAETSSAANFRPYTYWYLVSASCAISQHIAVIFVFLATFVRLKERLLDPRLLVWVSILWFIAGYSLWELLHWNRVIASRLTGCPLGFFHFVVDG